MKDYVANNFKATYSQYAMEQSLPIWGDLEGWSRETMFEKYPSISPYTYCANNPMKFVDPTGEDWYEAEDGKVTWTDCTNKKDFTASGIKGTYLGKTHKADGKYYSLFGQTMNANSKQGKITQKIDKAFINYANYLEEHKNAGNLNDNPYDAEWHEPTQSSTDFSGVVPFDNSFWSSGNVHGPNEMGKYAGMADIYFMVTGKGMSGKFECFSRGMKEGRLTGNTGQLPISGFLLYINSTSSKKPIVTLRFNSKSSVESFQTKFFNLFPNARPSKK
jgi:hypothetical protein